ATVYRLPDLCGCVARSLVSGMFPGSSGAEGERDAEEESLFRITRCCLSPMPSRRQFVATAVDVRQFPADALC
ncbi:TPA: hypothetical protein ACXK45_000895, partial [Pseudomonas aeruginosa]